MSELATYVVICLLLLNLVNVLLVQRMLQKHHDYAREQGEDKPDESVEQGGRHVAPRD